MHVPAERKSMLSLRVVLLSLALIVTIPIGCFTIQNERYKRSSIPRKLHQGWFFAEGACNRFLSYQGAYAINLNGDTINEIKKRGLSFFNDINNPDKDRGDSIYFSGAWKETPIPKYLRSEGTVPNLHCGEEYSWFWPKGIVEALNRPGSYYLGTDRRNLYVIPDLGLVVASGSDR